MAHFKCANVVCLLRSFVFCVCLFNAAVLAQRGLEDDDGCRTPAGGVGNCINVQSCKPITDFLRRVSRPIPQTIKNRLNAYTCQYQTNSVKVCCPTDGLGEWAVDDDGCRTPDGGIGDCISIRNCQPIKDVLATVSRPISQKVRDRLNSFTCGYESNSVKVCCPNGPVSLGENGGGNQGTTIPPPPDVSAHRNFRLLPEDCGYLDIGDKIRNGINAKLNEFPWMALLSYRTRRGPQFKCGATIIAEKWILTAAHCIAQLTDPLLGVRVGEHNIQTRVDCEIQESGENKCSGPVQDLAVEGIFVHPEYNATYIDNDIGLLKVTRMNLNVENVRPVCLPTGDLRVATYNNVIVTGWGVTNSGQSSNILQRVDLPIMGLEQCKSVYKADPRAKVTYKQICAGGKDNKDSCPGDSGGPLHVAAYLNEETRYVQQGVVSFGPKICGLEGFPGVYTRIPYYMNWILDTIGS